MTLAISVNGPDYILLLADQRLMASGVVVQENSNKLIAVCARNGRMAIGYSGLAFSPDKSFVTRDWLLHSAVMAASVDPTYLGISHGIAKRAAATFAHHPALARMSRRDQRLTIIIPAFTDDTDPSVGRLALISNYQNFDTGVDSREAWREFRIRLWTEAVPGAPDSLSVQRIGAWQGLVEKRAEQIEALVREGKPVKVVAEMAADQIRAAALGPLGGSIGSQVSGVIIRRNRNEEIELWFSTAVPTNDAAFPDFINAAASGPPVFGRFTQFSKVTRSPTEAPAWIPRVPRRRRCPCGSGKRYGACHGKRSRGSNVA